MATKTAIIVICQVAILIYAIPPLSPQPPDFSNLTPTHIPLLFTIPIPDAIVHHSGPVELKTLHSWYFGSTSLYFDMFFGGDYSKLYRFQIILKADLSTAFLHVINSSERRITPRDFSFVILQDYRLCDDTIISYWFYDDHDHPGQYNCGVYMGLNFSRFAIASSRTAVLHSKSHYPTLGMIIAFPLAPHLVDLYRL